MEGFLQRKNELDEGGRKVRSERVREGRREGGRKVRSERGRE